MTVNNDSDDETYHKHREPAAIRQDITRGHYLLETPTLNEPRSMIIAMESIAINDNNPVDIGDVRTDNIFFASGNKGCNSETIFQDEGYSSQSLHDMDVDNINSHKSIRLSKPTGRYQDFIQFSEAEVVFSQNMDGDTWLHLAILFVNIRETEHCISLAPNQNFLNIVNNQRQTPLHLAVILKIEPIARRLMTSGASVDVRDSNGNTPLHIACRDGDTSLVQCLLKPVYYQETHVNKYDIPYQRIPQDLETRNYEGYTCLHIAGMNNHFGVLELLLKKGAKINNRDGKSGRTLLHHAAETGNQELTEYLLKQRKIDINCLTYCGRTPISLAAGRGHLKIVEYLIANGADCSHLRLRDDVSDDESTEVYDDFHINGKPILQELVSARM